MKTLKQFIFSKLEAGEYILDKDVANFLGKEPNFCTAEEYKREWHSLNSYKERFEDFIKDKTAFIVKYKRDNKYAKDVCFLSNAEMDKDNQSWKITKAYYEYLVKQGIKEL